MRDDGHRIWLGAARASAARLRRSAGTAGESVRVLLRAERDAARASGHWRHAAGVPGRLGRHLGIDALAGAVAALVTIAYCISFSALVFQGELRGGLAMGLWALLMGSAVASVIVATTTTLPPAEAGPDNPAIAVFSVLAGTVAAPIVARGAPLGTAVMHVLVAMSVTTLATGLILWGLGRFRLGWLVRFVPYPVIGGFLAASGWLLLSGGIEVITGIDITPSSLAHAVPVADVPKVALAIVFAVTVFVTKQRTGNVMVLPAAFFGGAAALDLVLLALGLTGPSSGWFVRGSEGMAVWSPWPGILAGQIDWMVIVRALPEMGAVAGVTVLALLLDISALEVARARSADLDWEFRTNGIASIAAAPLGGFIANLSLNASRMLVESGSRARRSGLFAAAAIGLVVLTRLDLASLVPTPMLGGLLVYMGVLVLREALLRSPAQRSLTELGLALLITCAILTFGYLTGVILGFIGACLMFAFNYSRVGVIRRHVTRASFGSTLERAANARQVLEAEGERIHIFWLSGFIFFGSSHGLFERICDIVGPPPATGRRYVILDFQGVAGCDASAILSLVKLRNWARESQTVVVWVGLDDAMRSSIVRVAGPAQDDVEAVFATRAEALEWCEDRVLEAARLEHPEVARDTFEAWLARELGAGESAALLAGYLERRELADGEVLYTQGGPADTIELVASGCVAVAVTRDRRQWRVRRMSRRTVVGEMGFFRSQPRVASVIAEGPTVVHVLSRASYDRLMAADPRLGAAFLQFIVRALADRVDFANKEISALL